MERFAHAVQLRLTRQEMTALHRMAEVQRCSIEELIRDTLRLSAIESPPLQLHRSHLRVAGGAREHVGSSAPV
jgi:hypothetical protein